MDPRENLLRVYRELADWYERQRQPQMRDRFLMLAADAALAAGRPDEAERLRSGSSRSTRTTWSSPTPRSPRRSRRRTC